MAKLRDHIDATYQVEGDLRRERTQGDQAAQRDQRLLVAAAGVLLEDIWS